MRGKELGEEESYIFSSTKGLNVVKLRERNRKFILLPYLSNAVGDIWNS